jgi:signal transduction histidine kinase
VALADETQISTRSADAVAQAARPALPLAFAAFLATFTAAILGLAFVHGGLAIVWPAAGVVAGIWLITPSRMRPYVLVALALGLFAGNVVAGRGLLLNLMFVAANLGEAWLLRRLLRFRAGPHIRLATLPEVGWFFVAVAVTVTVGGSIGSAGLLAMPNVGFDYLQNWSTWISSRGIGMLTVIPAVVAIGRMTPSAIAAALREGRWTLVALGAVAVLTYLVSSFRFGADPLLLLLVMLALVYPLVLVIAARSEPAWSYLGLLLITVIVVWRLGRGDGLFRDDAEAAQAFLVVTSLWVLTLAVVMDQQRRARDAAQRSERSMRHALAAGRGFTFDYDPVRDVVRRSDPDQILAPFYEDTAASFFERVVPEDRARLQQLMVSISPARPMYEVTYGSRRPDGRVVWLQERAVGDFDADGRLRRLQGLTMDVTVRREAEEALREADRKKDRFIATLAHELRNPLAPIRTAAELLGSPQAGPAEVDWARRVIQRQVGHMGSLLDDLLDVARITRGKLELRKKVVWLDSVIDTAVEAARPLIDARQQALEVHLPQPAPMLEADPLRLAQVVSNLLTNAAKYSDAGATIQVWATIRGAVLELRVRDTGIGIPAEALPTIFQMFSQVDGTSGRSEGGLGIGLSLVKGLIELHGGTVTAHSEGPGRGSEFTVTLPCVPCGEAQARSETPVRAGSGAGRRRILVVDDNRDAADSLAMLLGLEGHEVRVAYAGRDGIESAREFAPDTVILDLGLPDLSGYEVARALRQEVTLASTTLIALTGWGQDEHRRRAIDAGFDHHVTKPVDPDVLDRLLGAG